MKPLKPLEQDAPTLRALAAELQRMANAYRENMNLRSASQADLLWFKPRAEVNAKLARKLRTRATRIERLCACKKVP